MSSISARSSIRPILVLGVGNTLLKDEGIGVHAARRLQAMELPDNVEVIEGGVLGLDLLEYMEDRERIIIIDAVKGGRKPGTIYRLRRKDIDMGENKRLDSVHDIDLPHVLNMADLTGQHIDPVIIGVEPKAMTVAYDELSPEIEELLPKVIDVVLREIGG